MTTLHYYIHFNNTNHKTNPGDMFVNFFSSREKKDTSVHYLLVEILYFFDCC